MIVFRVSTQREPYPKTEELGKTGKAKKWSSGMQQQNWVQQRKQSKGRPGGERQEMEEAQREKKSEAEHQESKPVPFFFFPSVPN